MIFISYVSAYVALVVLYVQECNTFYTFFSQLPYLQTFPDLKHAGSAKKVNPKDIAKLGGTSLILGCHLKAMERIGEGINNSEILF